MKQLRNGFRLASGRKLYANNSILGISVEEDFVHGDRLVLSEGYDGYFDGEELKFTSEEKAEIADYMIDLWTKFKETI